MGWVEHGSTGSRGPGGPGGARVHGICPGKSPLQEAARWRGGRAGTALLHSGARASTVPTSAGGTTLGRAASATTL